MPLTRDFRVTIRERLERDPGFREALLEDGVLIGEREAGSKAEPRRSAPGNGEVVPIIDLAWPDCLRGVLPRLQFPVQRLACQQGEAK